MLMLMMVAVLGYVFIIMDSLRSFQVYSGFFVKLIIHPAKSNRLLRGYDWNVAPFFFVVFRTGTFVIYLHLMARSQ